MKLFISYCEKDGEGLGYARRTKGICKQKNIEAWVWHDDSSGAEWLKTDIVNDVKSSDAMLTIVSRGTEDSEPQKEEWSLASSFGKINSSLRVKGLAIPLELRSRKCPEFKSTDFEEICKKTIDDIAGFAVSFLELVVSTERTKRILELAHETGALLYGDFTLASGKKSNHYFEGKRLTLHPEGAYLVGREILDRLAGIDIDAIGGLAMGAFPIITAVALVSHLEERPLPSFIVREQPKEHGAMRKIEGHFKEGSRVAIVDDVITTGGSVRKAIEAVEAANCKVVKVIVIVDRHEGGSDKLKKEGYDFDDIIDLWTSVEVGIGESSATTGEVRGGILPR